MNIIKLVPISLGNLNLRGGPDYIHNLNDPEVNKYLELRFNTHTLESVKKYIEGLSDDKNVRFFTIRMIDKDRATWVGNIKLQPINFIHGFAEIGIIIFKEHWNKGYGSEAIKLLSDYAFRVLHLHKLYAGCLAPNIASIKAFEKAGFKQEYVIKNQYLTNGNGYVDDVVLSLFNQKIKGEVVS